MRNLFILVLTLLPFFAQATNPIDSTTLKTPWADSDTIFSRKGFSFSIGMGIGSVQQKIIYNEVESETDNFFSVVADMTVGFGVTEQISVFLTRKANIYLIKDEIEEKIKTGSDFKGIGGTYYLLPTAKSPFITAGVGMATYIADMEENIGINGLGVFVGGGYYVNETTHVKIEAIWGNPNLDVLDKRLAVNALSIGLSVNYDF